MLDTILENVDGITLGLDVGTTLDSLDGSFDGFNDGNLGCFSWRITGTPENPDTFYLKVVGIPELSKRTITKNIDL